MAKSLVRIVLALSGVLGSALGVACGDAASTTSAGPPGIGAGESRDAGADATSPGNGGGGGGGEDSSAGTPGRDGSTGVDAGGGASDGASASPRCTGRGAQPLDATWTLTSGGQSRAFNVHVPASYDPSRASPVVLNFHGYSSNAAEEDLLAQMSVKSDKEGFVAVHPKGLSNSWNAGACCGNSAQTSVDDVGFVRDLLDRLEQKICVDTHRVFATGMSNGGFLSHRLGCEMSSRIAAIAPVAGVLAVAACSPTRAMPVMEFHGTADTLVPYNGNASQGFPDVASTFAAWAKRDACIGQPTESYRNADAHCSTYATCAGGATVTLCTIDGGGHTWPGGTPVPSLGYTTPNLSATDAMWDFFTKHPLP
jgi:polyhydroxybutyrate depolymerase